MLKPTRALSFTPWLLAVTMGLSPVLQAATCKISTTANPTAYPTIQSAIDTPQCTTIKVPDGIFKENLVINRNLALMGNGPTSTIVDGGQMERVVYVVGGTVTLQGLAIQNGIALNFGGGGILNQGTLTVQQCTITSNRAGPGAGVGGGIVNNGGSLQVLNTLLSGNVADANGGGIYALGNNNPVSILNSTIVGNSSGVGGVGFGGGIYMDSGQLILDSSFLSGNAANNSGGGIYQNHQASVTLRNHSLISGNHATLDSAISGGGIFYLAIATLTIDPTSHVINNIPDDVFKF